MELEWYEEGLIIALRELTPFCRKHDLFICSMDINSRDGDYLVYTKGVGQNIKMTVIWNPGFDILIENNEKSMFGKPKHEKEISIAREINEPFDDPKLREFPSQINVDKDRKRLLQEYLQFMETDEMKKKLEEMNFFSFKNKYFNPNGSK